MMVEESVAYVPSSSSGTTVKVVSNACNECCILGIDDEINTTQWHESKASLCSNRFFEHQWDIVWILR